MVNLLLLTIEITLFILLAIKIVVDLSTKKTLNEIKTEQRAMNKILVLQTQLNHKNVLEKINAEIRELDLM